MPEKVNGNNYSGKSNIVSLNSSHTPIQPKSELQLNERDQKLATLQKMADNSPYSQRFAHFTSLANNSIPQQPVSQLSKDSNGLPDNLKQGVESLSGISMDDVKVHYNSDKPAQLNAHAYAQGTDIHIASGQEKHLPHEAWHVVQQKQGRVQPTTMMKAKVFINDDQGLEKEADVMGARALQMKPFSLSDYWTEKSVQRKEIIQRAIPGDGTTAGIIAEYTDKDAKPAKAVEVTDLAFDGMDLHNLRGNSSEGLDKVLAGGAWIPLLQDTTNAINVVADYQEKENSWANIGDLAATGTKFVVSIVDTVDKYSGGTVLGEALNKTNLLLPGIKGGLDAFKNGIELYKNCQIKDELFFLKTKNNFNDEVDDVEHKKKEAVDNKIIDDYIWEINKNIGELSVDFILSAAECALLWCPVAATAVGLARGAINLFKDGVKKVLSYIDDRERNRAERIGTNKIKDIEKRKLEEKSGRMDDSGTNLFSVAFSSYKKREYYRTDPKRGKGSVGKDIEKNYGIYEKKFKMDLAYLNLNSLVNEEVNEDDLMMWLSMEIATINQIYTYVKNEKSVLQWFAFQVSKKKDIIDELEKNGQFHFADIQLKDVANLKPSDSNYFFNKTREAIHAASNREHFSTNERLKIVKEMLYAKKNNDPNTPDSVVKYLIEKYPEGVYEATDDTPTKFTKSVDKLIKDVKI